MITTGIAILLVLFAHQSVADEQEIGSHREVPQELQIKRSMTVSQVPCDDVLQRVRDQTGIPIIRDRRIDPTQPISLETGLVSTKRLLTLIGENLPNVGVSFADSFVYVGPAESATPLRTLAALRQQEIDAARQQFPKDVFRLLVARQPADWPDVTPPRQLLRGRCRSCGLRLINASVLPHDLWPAGQLPPLPFADFATIVLSQFDLTFHIDPERAELSLVPRPDTVALEQRHAVPRSRRSDIEQWLTDHSADLESTWQRAGVQVTATIEIHEQLTNMIKGDVAEEIDKSESLRTQLFTLSLPADTTYRQVIEQLRQSGIPIQVRVENDEILDRTVEVEAEQQTGADFFAHLFRDLPVEINVRDDEVVIQSASP